MKRRKLKSNLPKWIVKMAFNLKKISENKYNPLSVIVEIKTLDGYVGYQLNCSMHHKSYLPKGEEMFTSVILNDSYKENWQHFLNGMIKGFDTKFIQLGIESLKK